MSVMPTENSAPCPQRQLCRPPVGPRAAARPKSPQSSIAILDCAGPPSAVRHRGNELPRGETATEDGQSGFPRSLVSPCLGVQGSGFLQFRAPHSPLRTRGRLDYPRFNAFPRVSLPRSLMTDDFPRIPHPVSRFPFPRPILGGAANLAVPPGDSPGGRPKAGCWRIGRECEMRRCCSHSGRQVADRDRQGCLCYPNVKEPPAGKFFLVQCRAAHKNFFLGANNCK
jgi:hypothetical protein